MTTDKTPIRTAAPGANPVTVAEAKVKLRIASAVTTYDDTLTQHIETATELFEQDTDRAIITQDFRQYRDVFSDEMALSPKPVASITSIKYQDADNAEQTLSSSIYTFDQGRRHVAIAYDQEWPSIAQQRNGIQINYRCGYGADGSTVPSTIKDAILCKVAELHTLGTPEAEGWREAYEVIVTRLVRTGHP